MAPGQCAAAVFLPDTRHIVSHHWADTLVYRVPDKKEIVPCLAESYRVVDGNTLEFTLRPGIRFHNGEPLTV